MTIYLASSNKHKQKEIQELFPNHEILLPSDKGIIFDPEETGSTFFENSFIKAKALYDLVKTPVLADDSGLCVEALNYEPGIFTSRYAGPSFMHGRPDGKKITQEEQNKLLIEQLNETKSENRKAFYVCSLILLINPYKFYSAQETLEGTLIEDISLQKGNGGFGYDPIVFLPEYNKTVAELTSEQKNEISHRGKAVCAIKKLMNGNS